jgi:hypothetical protein
MFLEVLDLELKNTNRELDEWLTWGRRAPRGKIKGEAARPGQSGLGALLPLSAPAFSNALHASLLLCDRMLHGVAPSKCSRPHIFLHDGVSHLITLLWVTSMLPCFTCSMRFLQRKVVAAPPCLSFACALMTNVGGTSRDASWCMCG